MSKSDTWMPFYIADYLRKTMHLTREQHGGYLLLLMACWDRGGRLPNDPAQLAGIVRATQSEWRKLAPVLLPFFEIDGAFLTQGRVLEEREKAARLSEARRQAGQQGGRPRKQPETENDRKPKANGFANGELIETHAGVATPSPSPLTPPEERSSGGLPKGSRLPPDWVPSELDRAYGISRGFTPPAVERMAEKFRNYWTAKSGKDATKRDWPATWRNWVLTEAEKRPTGAARAEVDWIG